jgi:DNA-directed RNA polymerase specialized sigma24 family protein
MIVAEAAMAAAPMAVARPARAAMLEPAIEATFDETLARYGAEIYRFALHLTRNRPDADDLYQETALKAYRAWDRLPCDANHRAWLYRIASNAFLSDKRKTSRLRSLDAEEAVDSIPAASLDDDGRLDAGNLLREVETTYCAGAAQISGYWLPGDRGHPRLLRRGRAPQRA